MISLRAGGATDVGQVRTMNEDRLLTDDPVTIGRLPDCDVVLADTNVSRRHAEVRRQGNGFVVVDLGSTNGTKVNGLGVRERRLADGDEILVGNTKLRFEAS